MRINYVSNLKGFMESWGEVRLLSGGASPPFQKSPQGNINCNGTSSSFSAAALPVSHPHFEEALEDGVKHLVKALINKFDCITYSSCEGHRSAGPGVPMRPREVQILPRNTIEHQSLSNALTRLAVAAQAKGGHTVAKLAICDDILYSDNAAAVPCLRIVFECRGDEELYFQAVDKLYGALLYLVQQG